LRTSGGHRGDGVQRKGASDMKYATRTGDIINIALRIRKQGDCELRGEWYDKRRYGSSSGEAVGC